MTRALRAWTLAVALLAAALALVLTRPTPEVEHDTVDARFGLAASARPATSSSSASMT